MPEVIEIRSIEELDAYRFQWRSLFAQTRRATIFQTYDWLQTYWQHFGEDQQLRVLMISSQGSLIGILPLVVRREQTRLGTMRVLTYPLADWGSFFGPIGPNPTATLLAGMQYLSQSKRDWDLLDLRWVDDAHVDHDRTSVTMQMAGLMPSKQVWKDVPVIDVAQSWNEYLATRKTKNRQNIRRLLRRAEEREIQFDRIRPLGSAFCDDDPQWETYNKCVDLASKSWQGASITGTTISHESVMGYFRDVHQIAAQRGMLDLSILKQGEETIAFGYNYHHENHIQGMRVGYDTEKKNLGLGTLLYATQLRDCCDRDDLQFDLGPGSIEVKQYWLSKVVQSWRICHYSATSLRSQALRLKHWYSSRQREKSVAA